MESSNSSVYLPVRCCGASTKIFPRLLKIPISLLKKLNVCRKIFLGNILIMVSPIEEMALARDTLIFLLLGLSIFDKYKEVSLPIVSRNTVSWDGERFSEYDPGSPSSEKKTKQNSSTVSISTDEVIVTIKQLTQLIGQLIATAIQVLPALLQYRPVQRQQILDFSKEETYDCLVTLTEEVKGRP